jgi:hypothetical protein
MSAVSDLDSRQDSLLIDHDHRGAGGNALGAVLTFIAIGGTRGTDGLLAITFRLVRPTVEACHWDSMSLALHSLRRNYVWGVCRRRSPSF